LTYANVMATVAVFIALGGSSYAAISLSKNSVGASQLKAGSVRGSEVKNGSLGVGELKGSARASLRGQKGATGAQGPKGDAGAAATTLWAVLNPDGTLRRGSGVVSVGPSGASTAVKFNQPISSCAIVSSIGRNGSTAPAGESNADEFVTNAQPNDTVIVTAFNSAGAIAQQSVHVAVFC
jgi:hypothetical protein